MFSIIDLHHDYLLISKMKIPTKRKARLITELLAESDNPWRVIGITEKAFKVFSENDFDRIPRMRINRAHLVNRIETFTHLFEKIYTDPNEWWNYYYDRDKTILSTSSENMTNDLSSIIYFDRFDFFNVKDNLFKTVGFTWSYSKKKEKQFLMQLAKELNA
ncbi:hypothetical protein CYL31_06890 [Marinomonas sp. A3A]|nr:hypothetical protein [Marinomonas sp. A3A]QUX91156.1 hypothetical protein CYL31_06890 [Marinomonas sp. A3A]